MFIFICDREAWNSSGIGRHIHGGTATLPLLSEFVKPMLSLHFDAFLQIRLLLTTCHTKNLLNGWLPLQLLTYKASNNLAGSAKRLRARISIKTVQPLQTYAAYVVNSHTQRELPSVSA